MLVFLITVSGCALWRRPVTNAAQADQVTGFWSGQLLVTPCSSITDTDGGRCNATNRITLLLYQTDNGLGGSYTCSTGTMICRNGGADSSGTLTQGSINGDHLRFSIIVPADVSSCDFRGAITAPNHAEGLYECVEGGGLVDQGQWQLERESPKGGAKIGRADLLSAAG
ncbi:MAG TPA: hypothetical protein VKV28_14470 [Candidatus Binataceae bacterium]|nr:hypothetical protein [Candidatus Binataceae bacterium]